MNAKKAKPTNLRFTPEGRRLLQLLATKLGLTLTSVVELAVRELAERKQVK